MKYPRVEDLHKAILKSKGVRRKLTNDSLDLSTQLQAREKIIILLLVLRFLRRHDETA